MVRQIPEELCDAEGPPGEVFGRRDGVDERPEAGRVNPHDVAGLVGEALAGLIPVGRRRERGLSLPKIHPRSSSGMLVFGQDAAESVASSDVEPGDLTGIGAWYGQGYRGRALATAQPGTAIQATDPTLVGRSSDRFPDSGSGLCG